ncbi:hypothetical protein CSUI_005647, partial [Cystoisospora suis]
FFVFRSFSHCREACSTCRFLIFSSCLPRAVLSFDLLLYFSICSLYMYLFHMKESEREGLSSLSVCLLLDGDRRSEKESKKEREAGSGGQE